MTDWAKKSLGDISSSCLGKMLDKAKNKGIYQPYLANLNVQWGEFKLESLQEMRFEEHEQQRYGVVNGDLIICEGGEPGRCAVWRGEVANMKIQKALHRLRVNADYSSDFLYYRMLLAGKNRELYRHFIGSTIKHLTGIGLKGVEFEFPRLDEQSKISSILRSLDEKIELNNKINTELEVMAKQVYDYWFVQFDFPDANGKPYKSSGGKMVYNEELKREIPDGWEVCSLGKYASVKKGQLITKKTVEDGKIKVVAAGIDFSYFHSTPNYKKNTITVSGSGASAGFVNFWRESIFASDCITVRGTTDADTFLILHYLLLIQDYIFKQARGSAQPHVYPDDISILKYVIAPNKLIEKFGNMVLSSNDKISVNNTENEKLIELRDWLLPMLMNGQVTVK